MKKLNKKQLFDKWKKQINKNIDDNNVKNLTKDYLDLIYNDFYIKNKHNKKILLDEEKAYHSFSLISEVYLKEEEKTRLKRIREEHEKILFDNFSACGCCGLIGHNKNTCNRNLCSRLQQHQKLRYCGHNRNTCPRQFGINTAFYDDGDMVLNKMGKTLVPWQSHKIVRNRPSKGRSCTYCSVLGHNKRKYPWANTQGRNLQNIAGIRAAAKKYFEAPKSCLLRKAGEDRIDNDHKRALIQVIVLPNVWLDIEYRLYYRPYHRPRQIPYRPYRPRRRRIPNYIAACRCCGSENHARNDQNAPCRNQNYINPRLVRLLREQRLYYIENGIQMPNNI
ncbi:15666_t:CDS:2, partial [Dentiscutata erythropus]